MSHCFAPGCNTNYVSAKKRNKSLGLKNPSVFSAPKDPDVLKQWRKIIPRGDKIFCKGDKLCELHFDEECIIRDFENKISDGTLVLIERARPILKAGSVPTKFPNLYKCLSSNAHRRKRLRTEKEKVHEMSNETVIKDHQFVLLVKELEYVEKPDSWWTVSQTLNYVICAKWDANCSCERRVVVFPDFSIKIFLRNKEISLTYTTVENIETFSELLHTVDKLIICQGVGSGKFDICLGFVDECGLQSYENTQCSACIRYEKNKYGVQRKKEGVAKKSFKSARAML